MLETRSVAEVKAILQSNFGQIRIRAEKIPLFQALGRVLSREVRAGNFIPDFDRSSVDGYAVKVSDISASSPSAPVVLKLIGQARMGEHTALRIENGETVYVPTGGEVPIGTEAVIMLEDTNPLDEKRIAILRSSKPGDNMIFRGEDMKPGDLVLPAGKRLKIADIGALAAMGIVMVPVRKKPRVGIISIGDELIPANQALERVGLVRDVNAPMLHHAIQAAGGKPHLYGIVNDDLSAIQAPVQKAMDECEIVLLSGSTSMDSRDVAAAIIDDLGTVLVHGVAVKPGKPTIVGTIREKPIFGLPGNPVSVYFTFYLFVRPLLQSYLGAQVVERNTRLPLASTVITNHGREEYLPVLVRDGLAHPITWKSNLITRVSGADGFICIPREQNKIEQGELVKVTFLDA